MTRMTVLDEKGNELEHSNEAAGQVVSDRMQTKASLIGAICLLEDIAKHDDNPHYRAAGRKMADGLKAMLRKMKQGKDLTDAEILGPLLEQPRRALSQPRRLIANDVTDVE